MSPVYPLRSPPLYIMYRKEPYISEKEPCVSVEEPSFIYYI